MDLLTLTVAPIFIRLTTEILPTKLFAALNCVFQLNPVIPTTIYIPHQPAFLIQTHLVFMIWKEMYLNGARTGMMRTSIKSGFPKTPKDRQKETIKLFAALRGIAAVIIYGQPFAPIILLPFPIIFLVSAAQKMQIWLIRIKCEKKFLEILNLNVYTSPLINLSE